jgi:hypothetical protein
VSGLVTAFVPFIPCWCRMILCTITRVEAVNAEVANSQVRRSPAVAAPGCLLRMFNSN